jgi:tetratricopeptide (TPR) repeat protein
VRCLYCGKGIGPVRLLRDREFCSPEHRSEYREQFRQRVYELLAPEPPPAPVAGFLERRTPTWVPEIRAEIRELPRSAAGRLDPAFDLRAAGGNFGHGGWISLLSATAPGGGPAGQPAGFEARIRLSYPAFGHKWPQLPAALPGGAAVLEKPAGAPAPICPTGDPIRLGGLHALIEAAGLPGVEMLRAAGPQMAAPAAPVHSGPAPALPTPASARTEGTRSRRGTPAQPGIDALRTAAPRMAAAPALRANYTTRVTTADPVAEERPAAPRAEVCLPRTLAAGKPGLPATAQPVDAGPRAVHDAGVPLHLGKMRAAALAPVEPAPQTTLSHEGQIERPAGQAGPLAGTAQAARPAAPPPGVPRRHANLSPMPCPFAVPPFRGELRGPGADRPAATAPDIQAEPHAGAGPRPGAEAPIPASPSGKFDVPLGVECQPPAIASPAGPCQSLAALPQARPAALFRLPQALALCGPAFPMHPARARFNRLMRGDAGLLYDHTAAGESNVRSIWSRRAMPARAPKRYVIGALAASVLLAGFFISHTDFRVLGERVSWNRAALRQAIAQRAALTMLDDFHAGLNHWKGVEANSPKGWSYNSDGYMHPGRLALYRPSVPLSDYRLEFLAQIESRSVDWVVRAQDANNYYALKFTVVEPGPRPLVAMVRYPVVGGNQGDRVQTPLRLMIHANTPYRVTVDVKGNRFRTYIEGQEADFWTEDRLKTGGVGFFNEAGERARLYWVKVESHTDFLGRICALLSGRTGQGETNMETQAMDYRHSAAMPKDSAPLNGAAEMAQDMSQEAHISRILSRAASLHLETKREEAALELRRAIEGGLRHPALFFALGQLQYELQEYAAAAQSYGQAALMQPLHPTAQFNMGVCLGRLERWSEAADCFYRAVANDPARMESHLALGACLVHQGRDNEALDAYDRFLARYPDHEEAIFGKAVALQKRDRPTEAAELYRRILARNPRSEEALTNLVALFLASQDYEQVRKYGERLAEAHPRSEAAYEGLAAAAFAAGDYAAAAEYSRKLVELAPHVFENWFNLGVACHKAGDLRNASDAYARAAQAQPDSPQAHLNLGVSLHEQGDLKGAQAAYERALEIDPKLPGAHWNLGLVHEQLGEAETAERLFAEVPANSPDCENAMFRIGHLRLQRGDYPRSIKAFQACLEKRADWPEARLNLGIAHWRAGDKDAAHACFQELNASGTQSKEALRGLAALALEREEYDKAFEIYRGLIDAGDNSPELLYNAGLICQKQGKAQDAAVLYREALKVNPQFSEALLNLGHALMSLGDELEARSCWRKAVLAKPDLAQHYFEPAPA